MPQAPRDETHFGFDHVALDDKQGLVDDVFHRVAGRYDLMNDLMSAGLHRGWKAVLVASLNMPRRRPFAVVDVAGGTGDVAFRILARAPKAHVAVVDINGDMLAVGRQRAGQRYGRRLDFIEGNAEALPLAGKHFDAYTIAFGIRNVPRIDTALAEAFRVLERGGHFLCLEFSKVHMPFLDALYDAYSFNVIPVLGRLVTGDGEPYRYLVESIRRFPTPLAFSRLIAEAGFGHVTHRTMAGGIVALHSAWKL